MTRATGGSMLHPLILFCNVIDFFRSAASNPEKAISYETDYSRGCWWTEMGSYTSTYFKRSCCSSISPTKVDISSFYQKSTYHDPRSPLPSHCSPASCGQHAQDQEEDDLDKSGSSKWGQIYAIIVAPNILRQQTLLHLCSCGKISVIPAKSAW